MLMRVRLEGDETAAWAEEETMMKEELMIEVSEVKYLGFSVQSEGNRRRRLEKEFKQDWSNGEGEEHRC